jgi:hypothetical protein
MQRYLFRTVSYYYAGKDISAVIREWVFREKKRLLGPFFKVFTFFALVGKTDRLARQGLWPIKNFYSKNTSEKTGFSWRNTVLASGERERGRAPRHARDWTHKTTL